jgi:hypothetical protein
MRVLLLTVLLFLTACSANDFQGARDVKIEVIGTNSAYCILSTPDHRYALDVPGTAFVEVSTHDLKVDCRDNAVQRRRVLTVKPAEYVLEPFYPDVISVDFSVLDNGSRFNGFRVDAILTEDSFSQPIDIQKQLGTVKKTYVMGRESYPLLPIDAQ